MPATIRPVLSSVGDFIGNRMAQVFVVFLILAQMMGSAVHGEDITKRMNLGNDALAAGLWEVAAMHYRECLAATDITPEQKSAVGIRMAETLIRDGRLGEALVMLNESFVSSHGEVDFWKGQAMARMGRIGEAIEALNKVLGSAEKAYHSEAAFTIANLHLALGKTDDALSALADLSNKTDARLAVRARLHQIEILLETGRVAEAREVIASISKMPDQEKPLASFLEAQLLLAEEKPAEAAVMFSALLESPSGQSLSRHHMAAVGLADSLLATGEQSRAAAFLLTFIPENPRSPRLEALFKRLRDAVPKAPTVSDPVLLKLAEWILPPEFPATGLIAMGDSGVASAWPVSVKGDELAAHAMFARADVLRRITTPEALAEAKLLLSRLRLEFPQHPMADRALLESARIALGEGATQKAFNMLGSLRESAQSMKLRGEAAFVEATSAFASGDADRAVSLFAQAGEMLDGKEGRVARFNSAMLQLVKLTENSKPGEVIQANPDLAASLMLEQALAMNDPLVKREAIEDFLLKNPTHSRVPEARLGAAEAAITSPAPDLSFARAQIDTLLSEPDSLALLGPERIDLVRLRLADLAHDPEAAIAIARDMVERYSDVPTAAEASLVLGRNLFEASNYNEARMVLEKLASTDPDPSRAEAAWFLAAKSAALIPTSQSQAEALILFEKAAALKGSLEPLSKLEKNRLMIDMNRLPEAVAQLQPWFESLDENDPLRLASGLLLGEAIYAQGGNNPSSLMQALGVYDRLLQKHRSEPALAHRLQYLRGRTLEQLPDENEPSGRKERDAFAAFYSVLETDTAPEEWHYFELCGFRALALLEKAGRWPAAVACARKIASFNGPRAAEASSHADQLQLKHMLYDD